MKYYLIDLVCVVKLDLIHLSVIFKVLIVENSSTEWFVVYPIIFKTRIVEGKFTIL